MSDGSERSQDQRPPKARRSRTGCNECRRLHRKCDEEKPACKFCRETGKECVYGQRISWGGRPFGKSSFGSYLSSGAVQKQVGASNTKASLQTPFVYGSASSPASSSGIPQQHFNIPLTPAPHDILQGLSSLEWLPQRSHLLLDHFVNRLGLALSLTKDSHDDLCSVVLPMALDTRSYLLAAVLSLAATHRVNMGLHEDRTESVAWRHQCIVEMQHALIQSNEGAENVFIAAALLICYSDILEGGEKPVSWSLHLRGALAKLGESDPAHGEPVTATRRHLTLRCKSLQKLVGFSSWDVDPQPLNASECRPFPADTNAGAISQFHGFATHLNPVLDDMHTLTAEKAALKDVDTHLVVSAGSIANLWASLNLRTQTLLTQVRSMTNWTKDRTVIWPEPSQPGQWNAAFNVGSAERDQWGCINEAYHHACQVYILCELQGLPNSDDTVKESVARGTWCMRQVEIRNEACPAAALLQPLFTIGCETTLPDDRAFIVFTLEKLRTMHGKSNAENAADFLKTLWVRQDGQDLRERVSVAGLMGE